MPISEFEIDVNFDVTKVLGSADAYRKFMASNVWKDMLNQLKVLALTSVNDYDGAENMHQVGIVQGRRQALEALASLPQDILDGLEEYEEEQARLRSESKQRGNENG